MTNGTRRGEGSASRPGRSLPPGKTRYPLYKRLGGPQGRSRQVREISPPPVFDPRTVQAVASRYSDWATGPTTASLVLSDQFQRFRDRISYNHLWNADGSEPTNMAASARRIFVILSLSFSRHIRIRIAYMTADVYKLNSQCNPSINP